MEGSKDLSEAPVQMETQESERVKESIGNVAEKIDQMDIQANSDVGSTDKMCVKNISDTTMSADDKVVSDQENTDENNKDDESVLVNNESVSMNNLEIVTKCMNSDLNEAINEKVEETITQSGAEDILESVNEAPSEIEATHHSFSEASSKALVNESECKTRSPMETVKETEAATEATNVTMAVDKSELKTEADGKDIYKSESESPNGDADKCTNVKSEGDKNIITKPPSGLDDSARLKNNVSVSKTVALDHAEEGELDYEEEEIAEADTHHVEHEEGEIMEDKDAEGSEEGEIVSDEDDQQASTKKTEKEEGELNEDDDLEEGQLDEEVERGHRPRTLCKYYEAGTCRWGMTCRFLHPGINDKGNYLMHRPPGMYPTAFGKPPPPNEIGPLNPILQRGPIVPSMDMPGFIANSPVPVDLEGPPTGPKKESAWERGLKKAKEIKLASQKRREEDEKFEEKRMNLSIKETPKEPERPPPAVRREQWRPGFERENQVDKYPQRSRPADFRQDTNERRFNRSRKSPPKRYDQERDRNNRAYDFDKEKPRDMDRERFLRLQRRKSPTPPERRRERDRNRDRERDKPDTKRERRPDTSERDAEKRKETNTERTENSERKEKPETAKEEKPVDTTKEEKVVGPTRTVEAEQWRDPWMRTQAQPAKSPDRKTPPRRTSMDYDVASGDSSASDSDSDSEESDESGSGSDSESKESSDGNEEATETKEVTKPSPVIAQSKESRVSTPTSSSAKDPRLKNRSSKDNTPKRDSPQTQRDSSRASDRGYQSRFPRDPRDHDRRRRSDEPERRGRDRSDDRDRKHRDRRDGHGQSANSFPQWLAPHQIDPSWQRGGYNQFMNTSYRGIPDRTNESRRPEGDPRTAKGDRTRSGRRGSPVRSSRDSPYSHKSSSVRDPRRRPQELNLTKDKDRKQPNQEKSRPSPSTRRQSPKQKDPRIRSNNADSSKRADEDKRAKDSTKSDRDGPPKEKHEAKPDTVKEPAKKTESAKTKAHKDVSEDEFESPKYGESGSESDSDSDSEVSQSESESDSEAESEIGSASPSGSANDLSNSESDGDDSDSDSDNDSSSSDEDMSPSKKKEIEKKKKDFKMVLSMAKTSAVSHKGTKSQNPTKGSASNTSSKDHSSRSDPRSQIGQKRSLSGRNGSNASPSTGGSSKTAARKDELLKELRAIEDAIARKRAKID